MHTFSETCSERLYFLDWVRIGAFFLLILYHVGMYYVSWDWHVKSPAASHAIEPLMLLSSPWRLGLLFLVSGVASIFMLRRLQAASFMRQRSRRLLLPLLFGMLLVVPPQPYLEVVEKLGYGGSYLDFMHLYLSGHHGFCPPKGCLDLPTWNHLWFLPYLWCYSMLLGLWLLLARPGFEALSQCLGRWLTGWRIIVLPLALLALARLTLLSRFPSTHALVNDWYNHASYFSLFLLGALLAGQGAFWARVDAMRWGTLATALGCWAALVVYYALPDGLMPPEQQLLWRDLQRVVYALCAWCAILAVCGFAHRHLQVDNAARRYLTVAVFPLYIAHQTLIVVFAHALKPVGLTPWVEGLVLVVLTFVLSFAIVELVRRSAWLRPLFGIGPERALTAVHRSTSAAASPLSARQA